MATTTELKRVEGPVDPIDALARLPRDVAVMRMENDNIMSLALAHPRSHKAILADIRTQLETYPTFAKAAMYAKPVGRMEACPLCGEKTFYEEFCRNKKCGKPIPQKIARGLSIRAAEAIAAAYKYNKVRQSVTDLDADKVRLDVIFLDYQDGRMAEASAVLSKVYKTARGETKRTPDDRFYNVVCKAKLSILTRGCITFVVPPGLRAELEASADEILDSFLDDDTAKKIIAQFSQKNVSQAMLEKFFTRPMAKWTQEDRKVLLGIWTSLKDGETTVAELFGVEEAETSTEKPKGGNERLAKSLGVNGEEASATGKDSLTVQSADPAGEAILHKRHQLMDRYGQMTKPQKDVFHSKAGFTNVEATVSNITDVDELDKLNLIAVDITRKAAK